MRMYFLRDYRVLSATSTDGLIWGEESGVRLSSATQGPIGISSVTGFSQLTAPIFGGYRAVFTAFDQLGGYRLYTATSTEGLNWAIQNSTPIAFSTTTFVGSPQLMRFSDALWALYFTANTVGGAAPEDRDVYLALSADEGATWSATALLIAGQVGEVCVSSLTTTNYRLIYTAPLTAETTNSQMLSSIASDGVSFNLETDARLSTASTSGSLSFPFVMRSSETYRWRLYYAFTNASTTTPHIHSALTITPDPQRIAPGSVNRSDPATTFTITGEIFSPAPAVKITKTGQSDVAGTSVSRTNDQTLTAVIDPTGLSLGAWTVVVTNADAQAGSGTGSLTVTFAGGDVKLLDNLMRPLTGAQTRIDMRIFDAGHLRARLYTMDGRLLKTLFDGEAAIGTTTVFWDGKNEDGGTVASGVYVLRVEGPKLDSTDKIVVIK